MQLSKGYEVVVADRVSPAEQSRTYGKGPGPAYRATAVEFKQVDVADLGQVVSVTADADAIVHMAAYPSPGPVTEDIVFRTNVMNNWNILEAAEMNGIKKIVMASSINALGASFGDHQPVDYFPLDENHRTRAQDAYAQSKWIGEQMGDAFARRRPGGVQIASFRFHLLVGPTEFGMGGMGPSHWLSDPDGAEAASEREFFGWTGKSPAHSLVGASFC
jgi:UDP-glucose 4-epimerase